MPPIRGGVPVVRARVQSRTYKPGSAYLCQCSQCVQSESLNPLTKKPLKGRYLGKSERDSHRLSCMNSSSLFRGAASQVDHNAPALSRAYLSSTSEEMSDSASPSALDGPSDHGFYPFVLKEANHDDVHCGHSAHTSTGNATVSMNVEEESVSLTARTLSQALCELEHDLSLRHATAAEHGLLVFVSPPDSCSVPLALQEPLADGREINHGPFSIRYDEPSNSPLLQHEKWLLGSLLRTEQLIVHAASDTMTRWSSLCRLLESALDEVEMWKHLEWEQQRLQCIQRANSHGTNGLPLNGIPTESFLEPAIAHSNPLLALCYLLVTVLHLLCHVSIKHCAFVLTSIRMIMRLALSFGQPQAQEEALLSEIPSDVRTLLRRIDVLPVTRSYVCCAQCFYLYPLDNGGIYPDRCIARKTSLTPPCNAPLRLTRKINGIVTAFPVRRFIYQDFKHWLGRLLCRRGIEEIVDRQLLRTGDRVPEEVGDIFHTETLRGFMDSDGQPFISEDGSEGRYIFSLCMDGFQPHGRGGPPCSVGAIYLACLNLPPDLRYKTDNIFLAGIIPGPTHPSLEEINPLLNPLVDDFLGLWYQGVRYTATPCHPRGKTCRCAIIPLVCDILAARQMAGFTGHQHEYFCSFCYLKQDNIEDLNWWAWPARTSSKHREDAQKWKEATCEEERAQIYNETGVRWSELLRLPYWDPIKFTALDPMHALFINAFGAHVEKVWGVSADVSGDLNGISFDVFKRQPSADEMQAAYMTLRCGTNTAIENLRVDVLRQLCKEQGLRFSGHKLRLKERLRDLRIEKGWYNQNITDMPEEAEQISSAVDALEMQATSSLGKFRRAILQQVCVQKIGGSLDDYRSLTKDTIMEKLRDYRIRQGIMDGDGRLLHRQAKTTRKDMISSPADISEAVKVVEQGTKTDLGKLPASLLLDLCAQVLNGGQREPFVNFNKSRLLDALLSYREANGLGKKAIQNAARLARAEGLLNISRTTSVLNIATLGDFPLTSVNGEPITQEELANAEDILERGSKRKFKSLSTAALRALCMKYLDANDADKLQREQALEALHAYRVEHAITNEDGSLVEQRSSTKSRILGRNILELIWSDMDRTILPSWISPAPRRVGAAGRAIGLGLGADEWRSFCTINLPGTLIHLWGSSSQDSREYQLLENFMDLVSAVKLASARITSQDRQNRCREYTHRYLTSLLRLFPGTTIRPNQHMLLHLPDILQTLGPAHTIWCFGFERSNYTLQQTATNNKIDELSTTLFTRFCSMQALRNFFTSQDLPASIRPLVPHFVRSFQSDIRGTLLNDILALRELEHDSHAQDLPQGKRDQYVVLPENLTDKLRHHLVRDSPLAQADSNAIPINPFVIQLDRIEAHGVSYRTADKHVGDSNIIFTHEQPGRWKAGRITRIFCYEHRHGRCVFKATYLVVQEYVALSLEHKHLDPYRKFPVAGGRLFYDRFHDDLRLLSCQDVVCHFALVPRSLPETSVKCIYALPLDRW